MGEDGLSKLVYKSMTVGRQILESKGNKGRVLTNANGTHCVIAQQNPVIVITTVAPEIDVIKLWGVGK